MGNLYNQSLTVLYNVCYAPSCGCKSKTKVSVHWAVYLFRRVISNYCLWLPWRHVEVAEWGVLDGSSGKKGLLSSRLNIVLVDTCRLIACCQHQIIISPPMSKNHFSQAATLEYMARLFGNVLTDNFRLKKKAVTVKVLPLPMRQLCHSGLKAWYCNL